MARPARLIHCPQCRAAFLRPYDLLARSHGKLVTLCPQGHTIWLEAKSGPTPTTSTSAGTQSEASPPTRPDE